MLAVVLVCYAQDKINKSYQLDTIMKINEIASRRLDEANPMNIPGVKPVVKYVGPYFDKAAAAAAKLFGAGKGTTQAELDALRASETGTANAAGGGGRRPPTGERPLSTVSKDELNALLYPPRAAEPTVGSFLKRRGDAGFDPDLSKPQTLPGFLQNLPPARIGSVTRPSPSGPRPRPRPAAELGNTEPPLQSSTAAAEIGQIRPGAETPTPAAADSTAAGVPRAYTMDEILQFQELLRTNPAAAEETAKKMGWLKKGLTAAAIAAPVAGWYAGNKFYPDTIPSAGQLIDKGVNKLFTLTADPNGAGPPPGQRKYDVRGNEPNSDSAVKSSTTSSSDAVPPASNNDDLKDDPEYQELLRKALAGEKMNESTAALNRMVYLSKL